MKSQAGTTIDSPHPQQDKFALITGTSSGFGLLTSITLARRGWHVIATMREPARRQKLDEAARAAGVFDHIEVLPLDITQPTQIKAIADQIAVRATPLHALICNAGFSIAGFADDVTDAELRRQFDTNFFGSVAVTQAFLPQLRRQGFGRILFLSSISGLCGFPGLSSYAASKHALEGWAESLRLELLPCGIQVSMIEPGSFATDIWKNVQPASGTLNPDSINAPRTARCRKKLQNQIRQDDPQEVADGIARILGQKNPKFHNLFGKGAKKLYALRAMLPSSFYEHRIMQAYGLEE